MSFNKQNIDLFFNNLERVLDKYKFSSDRILNIDESGITTVLQAPKTVAPTGVKQVGQTVSAERGELVTFCGILKASGNTLPPAYVFPRVHFKDTFLAGAPNGSLGLCTRSGWMSQDLFLRVIQHVHNHTESTKENPILIILDNHESHISLDVITFCREKGIVLLTFPPHTSHRLQPLDISVFGPFKNYCKASFNKWLSQNPGMSITIKQIAYLSSTPYDEAFSKKNIVSGFKKAGINPFDRSVFTDADFTSSKPTDQPLPEAVDRGLLITESSQPVGYEPSSSATSPISTTVPNEQQPSTSRDVTFQDLTNHTFDGKQTKMIGLCGQNHGTNQYVDLPLSTNSPRHQ